MAFSKGRTTTFPGAESIKDTTDLRPTLGGIPGGGAMVAQSLAKRTGGSNA
jgi:hypothetical protein